MTNTNTNTDFAINLKKNTLAQKDTSKQIRYLYSQLKDQDQPIAKIEKLLKEYGITTKKGDPIRYQHVRNVVMMKLSSN